MPRLRTIAAIALIAAIPLSSALAQGGFPNKPIRFVVGAAPGGANDIMARTVAAGMNLGQPVVVENQAGAAATISAATVAKAPPDGHTLLLVSQSVLTVSPILNKVTTFDGMRDFTGVALFGSAPLILVVHPSNPANSVQDIVAMAKAKPGELSFGSGGVGTTPFMAGTLLGLMTGTKYTSIPFKGEQPSMTEIMGGRLTMMFGNAAAALPHMKSGRLKGLAITSPARAAIAPEMRTVSESGVPGFEIATWLGMAAPAATPPAVVAQLNKEVQRVLQQADVRERLHGMGFTLSTFSADEFTRFIRAEHQKWSKVIRDADIKAE
jgi:tripartite-type tricarboxylate transporter receptor subunit TctC